MTLKPRTTRVASPPARASGLGRPHEHRDHVRAMAIHQRRGRLAGQHVAPRADQRIALVDQVDHRRHEVQPRRQPRPHRVLVGARDLDRMVDQQRPRVRADGLGGLGRLLRRHRVAAMPAQRAGVDDRQRAQRRQQRAAEARRPGQQARGAGARARSSRARPRAQARRRPRLARARRQHRLQMRAQRRGRRMPRRLRSHRLAQRTPRRRSGAAARARPPGGVAARGWPRRRARHRASASSQRSSSFMG